MIGFLFVSLCFAGLIWSTGYLIDRVKAGFGKHVVFAIGLLALSCALSFGSPISGTNVAAPVVPFDTADTYPSHMAEYGKGGLMQFQYSTQRNAIPSPRRTVGMFVYVAETDKTYILKGGVANSNWVEFSGGTGPPGYTPQACVDYFDGANGTNGTNGIDGAPGLPGSQILTGTNAPASGLGVNGDFYMNTANGDYYQKTAGAWVLMGNLTGPEGPPGPPASVDQASVLSALAQPGGNPDERQPLAPQTNTTVMRQVRDLLGTVRLYITGEGTLARKDANGVKREEWGPDYSYTKYRGNGVTVAQRVYSSGRTETKGPVTIL